MASIHLPSSLCHSMFTLPFLVLGFVASMFYLYRWSGLTLRSCRWLKKLLRVTGVDKFDDFDVTILVHKAKFSSVQNINICSYIRISTGNASVQTDLSSKGVFQQPLSVFVPQGTKHVAIELLNEKAKLIATLRLDASEDILRTPRPAQEIEYEMSPRKPVDGSPMLRLTMAVDTDADAEEGLLKGMSLESSFLVRQQIRKTIDARKHIFNADGSPKTHSNMDLDLLKDACSGPLELFEGLRNAGSVYVAVQGPPLRKNFVLGIWQNLRFYEEHGLPSETIDLLRVRSVQPDPARANVFMINYYDKDRAIKKLTLRRSDRARDVWVETLKLLLQQLHAEKRQSSWGEGRDRERVSRG